MNTEWKRIREDAVMAALSGGRASYDALAIGEQVADELVADDPEGLDHWVVPNAVVNKTSTGYQAWSPEGHLAVQNRDKAKTWAVLKDGQHVQDIGSRNQQRAVNWHFMWQGLGDRFYWLRDGIVFVENVPKSISIINNDEIELQPGQDIRSGTSGGRVDQHITVYDSETDRVDRVIGLGGGLHWSVHMRLHQLLQCDWGYVIAQGNEQQHLSFLVGKQTNWGPFPLEGTGGQIFSHPYVTPDGRSLVFARQDAGPNIGDVQQIPLDGETDYTGAETLFAMHEMRAAYNASRSGEDELIPWVQWVYGHEVDGLMAYAVYEADPHDGTRIGGVSIWDRATGEHRNIVRGIRHPEEWTQWINPSLSPLLPDGTRWVAYQVGNDVHARKVSG